MLPTFRYATLEAVKSRISTDILTDPGPPVVQLISDVQIMARIEAASALLNKWTRQRFQPVPQTARVSAKGDRLLAHPDFLPFLDLLQIGYGTERTFGEWKGMRRIIPDRAAESNPKFYNDEMSELAVTGSTSRVAWERSQRLMSMLTRDGGFTKGFKNMEMIGWWAWLENYKKVEATLSSEITASTSPETISLANIIDATTGDFIEVGDAIAIDVQNGTLVPARVELAIVQAIAENAGNFDITIDAMHKFPFALPIGTAVYCFGRTPVALAEVAEYLSAQMVRKWLADYVGDTAGAGAASGILLSERTDNYSYTLAAGSGAGAGSLGKYTGSAQMDLALKEFVQPAAMVRLI